MSSTVFTGPVLAGNVLQSDGSGTLAKLGGSSGEQNVGFCVMAQSQAITQAGPLADGVFTTDIVIPADSQILRIYVVVTTVWDGVATTLGIGTTASAVALTAATAVAGATAGIVAASPGTDGTRIGNWLDVGTTDVKILVTSVNTGDGEGVLVVEYIQSINAYANGVYT
jgi:uncharacterized membrane protein YphA (DoxX/SURF4 family)